MKTLLKDANFKETGKPKPLIFIQHGDDNLIKRTNDDDYDYNDYDDYADDDGDES